MTFWVVALVGLGVWGVLSGSPTDRSQTTVAQALPAVDHATAEIASAATVDGQAVVSISDFVALARCHVTPIRSGGEYQRSVTALVHPGTEDAFLQRVAHRLPASYQATVDSGPPTTLTADAGFFVGLSGSTIAPGVVRFVLDTGKCRAVGDLPRTAASPTPAEQAPVRDVLTRLGVSAQSWQRYQVACPGGGTLTTVEAVAQGAPAGPLAVPGVTPIVTGADLYGYGQSGTQIGVRTFDGGIDVTATVLCG